jgi:hypothetical protein
MGKSRGIALLTVLGVLALLALLATTFAALAAGERVISRNFLDATRARLHAQSGLQTALARLDELASRGVLIDGREWRPCGHSDGPCAGSPCVERMSSGTYEPGGDQAELRIADANARIHVNDGATWGPDHSVSRNLARILDVLGAQPGVDVPRLGERVLRARPAGGYASVFDLLPALGHDREAFGRVRRLLTARSWSDPGVANPVPLSAEAEPLHPVRFARSAFRAGHQKNHAGASIAAPLLPDESNAIWGRDSLAPRWIEIVARSPVNVNRAPREVLMALLVDLGGVFVLERRREAPEEAAPAPCASPGGAYAWTATRYTYDAEGNEGDECGFLCRTIPFTGPGGRSTDGIPAERVVDEILACRERRPSPGVAGLDYAAVPFGGPFRSWAQFNLFVDTLVLRGLIADRRSERYWDLDARGRRVPASETQFRIASQAAGDVLKANFNPNLHLNELNPNRNLFTHVDKTDLVVHSTEFSFVPMGIFEVESEGRVLRGGETFARAKLSSVVRAYDAVRDTSQRDFHAGTLPGRASGPETNNALGLETGPEPDNGPAPSENGAEGYLQLPTVGGNFAKGERKPPGELWTTLTDPAFYPGARTSPPGGPHLGSAIHAHFQLDHAAHDHAGRNSSTSPPDWDGFRLPQGAWQTVFARRCCLQRNWEDEGEPNAGPYSPVESTRAPGRPPYRLVRSGWGTPPEVEPAATSDLRLDGAYVERGSAFGYWLDESESFNFNEGAVAFWMKPGFFPEATGKRRTLLSAGRYHAAAPDRVNPSPFGLYLVPAWGSENARAAYPGGLGSLRPLSLAFGLGLSSATGYNWEVLAPDADPAEKHATAHAFALGPTLNHEGHDDGKSSLLRAHEWIHVGVTWSLPRNRLPAPDALRIYVNGKPLPGTAGLPHAFAGEPGQPFARTPRWTTHSLQALVNGAAKWVKNSIRIGGETSKLFDLPGAGGLFPANFSADATFDEFYLWLDRSPAWNGGLWGIQTLWERGRYHRPGGERFVSRPLLADRTPRRLLGVAWTEIAEDYDREGAAMRPRAYDHSSTPPAALHPEGGTSVDLWLQSGGAWHGPFRNPGGSPARLDAAELRYGVELKAGPVSRSTLLLSSPVLDDVTLFFDEGPVRILASVAEVTP